MKTHSGSVFLCAVFLLLCLLISCGGQKDPVGTEADRTLPVSDSGTEKDTAKDLPESTTGAAQTESSAATEEKNAQPDPEETTTDGETTGDEEATGTGAPGEPADSKRRDAGDFHHNRRRQEYQHLGCLYGLYGIPAGM